MNRALKDKSEFVTLSSRAIPEPGKYIARTHRFEHAWSIQEAAWSGMGWSAGYQKR